MAAQGGGSGIVRPEAPAVPLFALTPFSSAYAKYLDAYPEFHSSLLPTIDSSESELHFKMLATPNWDGHNSMLHVSGCNSHPHTNGIYVFQSGSTGIFRHQNETCTSRIELLSPTTQDDGRVLVGYLVDDQTRIPIRLYSHSPPADETGVSAIAVDANQAPITNGCEPALPLQPPLFLALNGNHTVKSSICNYTGSFQDGKRHGNGVCEYTQSGSREQHPGLDYTWSKGDKYSGGWNEDKRHGPCTYTFFTTERFECTWVDGKCAEFTAKQNEVLEKAKSDASAALSMFGSSVSAQAPLSFPVSVGASLPAAPSNVTSTTLGSSNPFSSLAAWPAVPALGSVASVASVASAAPANPVTQPLSEQCSLSLHSGEMVVQAVPLALRVAFEDVLTSRAISVSISGATGPNAGEINGVYTYIAGSAKRIVADEPKSEPHVPKQASKDKRSSSASRSPPPPQRASIFASLLPLLKTTGNIVLEFRESTRRLVVCRSSSSGAGEVLMYCPVPILLPIYSNIPLLLAACASEIWFLESDNQPQPHVSVALPLRCTNSIFSASNSFSCGFPVYTSCDSLQSSISFNSEGRVWEMRSSESERVIAVSAASSIGFPAPLCWIELNERAEADQIHAEAGDSSSTAISCILISGASVTEANGVYFISSASADSVPSAHILGGLCSIENLEVEGAREWVLRHNHRGHLYIFKGAPSPFVKPTASPGTWIPIFDSESPRPVSIPLSVPESPVSLQRIESLRSRLVSHRRVEAPPIANALSATWTLSSDWKFFSSIPLIMTVTHIPNTALPDAALFEGNYELVDVLGTMLTPNNAHFPAVQPKPEISMYFRHTVCHNILHVQVSSDLHIRTACIYLEDESLSPFASMGPSLPSSNFDLCPEHSNSIKLSSNESAFSFNLTLKPSSPSLRQVSVLNVKPVYRPLGTTKHRHVVNPHFVPTLSDLSHLSCIKDMLTDDNADARQFWDRKLISLCGSSAFSDSNFISNVLEFSKSLTSDKSIHVSTAAIRHSNAFQAFVKHRMLVPMLPSISAFLDVCFQPFDEFQRVKAVSFDFLQQEFQSKVVQRITQEIVTFVESLCSNADFQCFLITYVLEQYALSSNKHQMALTAITSIVAAIFKFKANHADCMKARACILGLHNDAGNFSVSQVKVLTQRIIPAEPSLRDILRTMSSIIAPTSDGRFIPVQSTSVVGSFLQAELFQQLVLFGESISTLLKVCPSSIMLFKEEVSKSKALLELALTDIVSALSAMKASLAEFYKTVCYGFQLPTGWKAVKSRDQSRTYYQNVASNVLLLQRPRQALKDLQKNLFSLVSFLTIAIFENPGSKCSITETGATVAACFSSNEAFASSLSDAFSQIQAFQFLHHLPESPPLPACRELRLTTLNQESPSDAAARCHDIKFDTSSIAGRKICTKCLMFCSSLFYQADQQHAALPSAIVPSDEDLQFLDEMYDLAQAAVVQPRPLPPHNGHGVHVFPNNDRYLGEFKAGKMDGEGKLLFSSGIMYRGHFSDGYVHGQGVMLFCDGTKYEGSFVKGKRNGRGTTTYSTGNIHVGEWKDDKRFGEGHHRSLCDSRINGTVVFSGESFQGSYRDDWRNGVGTTTYFNGDTLTCNWTTGSSMEHDEYQRGVLAKSGNVFCLSCILNHAGSLHSYGDIGPTIAAVFAHERPLFQNCIRNALQGNLCCESFSDALGSPRIFSCLGSGLHAAGDAIPSTCVVQPSVYKSGLNVSSANVEAAEKAGKSDFKPEEIVASDGYVQSIRASSNELSVSGLVKGFPQFSNAYWQSSGDAGSHYLTIELKSGCIASTVGLVVDTGDHDYRPEDLTVSVASSATALAQSPVHPVTHNFKNHGRSGRIFLFALLDNEDPSIRFIRIGIARCYSNGRDTRVRGIIVRPLKAEAETSAPPALATISPTPSFQSLDKSFIWIQSITDGIVHKLLQDNFCDFSDCNHSKSISEKIHKAFSHALRMTSSYLGPSSPHDHAKIRNVRYTCCRNAILRVVPQSLHRCWSPDCDVTSFLSAAASDLCMAAMQCPMANFADQSCIESFESLILFADNIAGTVSVDDIRCVIVQAIQRFIGENVLDAALLQQSLRNCSMSMWGQHDTDYLVHTGASSKSLASAAPSKSRPAVLAGSDSSDQDAAADAVADVKSDAIDPSLIVPGYSSVCEIHHRAMWCLGCDALSCRITAGPPNGWFHIVGRPPRPKGAVGTSQVSGKFLTQASGLPLVAWRGPFDRYTVSSSQVKFLNFSTVRGAGFHRDQRQGYYEIQVKQAGDCSQFGFCTPEFKQDFSEKSNGCGDDSHSWGWDGDRRYFWNNGQISRPEVTWKVNDCLGFEVDFTKNVTYFSINGQRVHSHEFSGCIDTLFACMSAQAGDIIVSFGEGTSSESSGLPFKYPPAWIKSGLDLALAQQRDSEVAFRTLEKDNNCYIPTSYLSLSEFICEEACEIFLEKLSKSDNIESLAGLFGVHAGKDDSSTQNEFFSRMADVISRTCASNAANRVRIGRWCAKLADIENLPRQIHKLVLKLCGLCVYQKFALNSLPQSSSAAPVFEICTGRSAIPRSSTAPIPSLGIAGSSSAASAAPPVPSSVVASSATPSGAPPVFGAPPSFGFGATSFGATSFGATSFGATSFGAGATVLSSPSNPFCSLTNPVVTAAASGSTSVVTQSVSTNATNTAPSSSSSSLQNEPIVPNVAGIRVRRGRDWQWGQQDQGGVGTIQSASASGWVTVKWDHGATNTYRNSAAAGGFDLELFNTGTADNISNFARPEIQVQDVYPLFLHEIFLQGFCASEATFESWSRFSCKVEAMLCPPGHVITPSFFHMLHNTRRCAIYSAFLESSQSQCQSIMGSLSRQMKSLFQFITSDSDNQYPISNVFDQVIRLLQDHGSSSLYSAQPDVVVTGVSRSNTSNASAADPVKKTTQVAIPDKNTTGVLSSIDVYPEHVGETLESLRFAQCVNVSFGSPKAQPSVAPTSLKSLSLVDCLSQCEISSIISNLSPFSKLISFIALDDSMLLDFLGHKDCDGARASSFVPSLISSIVRSQKWSTALLDEMRRVSVQTGMQMTDQPHDVGGTSTSSFSLAGHSIELLRQVSDCIAALRACMERKVIALLHDDLSQALETILYKKAPQILATIGQYLRKVRSDKASFPIGHSTTVTQSQTARAQVTCSLCNACPLFEFVHLQGKEPVCLQCHASVSQSHSVRSCDLLSFYALKLLRGEAQPDDDDMDAVIKVFEYVYPSGEFSVSKAALLCISSTLKVFMFSSASNPSRNISQIVLPRWVAHALFPEYAVSVSFNLGHGLNDAHFAATLGWCQRSSDSSCLVTPLESAVLAALSGESDQSSSSIASKSGLPQAIVDFCMRRLSLKGLLRKPQLSTASCSVTSLPSEFRVPYSAALSTLCMQLLEQCEGKGYTDEAFFVWEALKSGQTIESVGCNIAHLITSSLVAASDGKLWTVTPKSRYETFKSPVSTLDHTNTIHLPPLTQCVLVKFDDSVLPSLSISTSVAAALPISATRFEELLSEAAQAVLEESSVDLSTFAATMKEMHGSLPRSIFSIIAGSATSRAASASDVPFFKRSLSNSGHNECYLCLLMGDENPIAFYNSCGHGLCQNCWKSLVSSAIASSSTPVVKSGEDLSGAVTVLSMKCSADRNNKCRAKIDFGVLCQAVPNLVQPFIRSTMSNLSRLLLSGGAGTCQCACGAVVSGIILDSEVQCKCGYVQCIADMKRGVAREGWAPHPHLTCDDLSDWKMLNVSGSEQRWKLMRFKNCPKCGTVTQKCGCPSHNIICNGMDKCPQEACDHMQCSKCGTHWCWICRRIGSTEPRCSRPDSSTDAKQLLPTVTAAVAELDKKLQALQPRQLSQVVAVKESILGLTLSNLAAADIVVTAGCAASVIPGWSWSLGDVIISCNGLPVQSSADFRRALQFSDTCAALVLVPAASVDQKAPLSAGWTLTHLSSGIVQYENTHNRHISYVHPQLLMKETVPVHITLNSYQHGTSVSVKPGTAETLLQRRASEIMKIQPPHAPPSGSLENIIDAQAAFNALFVNILKLDAPPSEPPALAAPAAGGGWGVAAAAFPVQAPKIAAASALSAAPKKGFSDHVRIAREVMNMCSPELLALFTDSSLSSTASKTLARFVKSATSKLKESESSRSSIEPPTVESLTQLASAPESHKVVPFPSASGGGGGGAALIRPPTIASGQASALQHEISSASECSAAGGVDAVPLISPVSLFSSFKPKVVIVNVSHLLIDERELCQRFRTQLLLTPHRASKFKSVLLRWASHGVLLAGCGEAVTLAPELTLGQLQHALQQPCSVTIDDGAMKDLLAAFEKSPSRSLRELGLFKEAAAVSAPLPLSAAAEPSASYSPPPGLRKTLRAKRSP